MSAESDLADLTVAYTDLLAERDSLRAALERIASMTSKSYQASVASAMRSLARQALATIPRRTEDSE